MHVTAHLSDIHIHDQRSIDRARATLDHVGALARFPDGPDAVVLTGDIANHGNADEYDVVTQLVAAVPVPVLTCPGNHDARGPYRHHLLGEPVDGGDDGPVNRAVRVGDTRYLLCDSTIPGADEGRLADETLRWLDTELAAEPDTPTYVTFHHPPVVIGAEFPDSLRLTNPDDLADVLTRHRNVAVLCGHVHTPAVTTFAGHSLLIASGVLSTANLDAERRMRGDDILDYDAPPLVSFHLRHDDGRITTHVRVVPMNGHALDSTAR